MATSAASESATSKQKPLAALCPGDKVTMNSGGPVMTVNDVKRIANCSWLAKDGTERYGDFLSAGLTIVVLAPDRGSTREPRN